MLLFGTALATAVGTLALIVVGGTINPTGSSLACPDWPLCYGMFFPAMKGGVQYEHTHRLVATGVGLLTCFLVVLIWRVRPADRALRRLGLLAFLAVVLQGILGGVTVLFRLPMAVSVSHLALSLLFLTLTVYICFHVYFQTGAAKAIARDRDHCPSTLPATLAFWAVFAQSLLGAFVRHTQTGRVCGNDVVLCAGKALWPALLPQQLHMAHRLAGAGVFFIAVAVSVILAIRARRQGRLLARLACLAVPWVALAQVALGLLTVYTYIGVVSATAHLGVGALLLALFAIIAFDLGAGAATRPEALRGDAS